LKTPDFYLASSEGYGLEDPRRCWRLRRISSLTRDDLLLVQIDPPLPGQKYGLGEHDLDIVLIATRHEKASLFPVTEWPVFVHVARLLSELPQEPRRLREDEFESIGWAELYPSEEAAQSKTM
jgi:hypothetical protein